MKASASILIKKPVAETFKAFADVENREKFLPDIKEIKIESAVKNGKGTQWQETRQMADAEATGRLEITTFNEPKMYILTTRSEGLIFKTRYNFQHAPSDSTKVVVSIGGQPHGLLGRIMDRFLNKNSQYIGAALHKELESYKKELEKD